MAGKTADPRHGFLGTLDLGLFDSFDQAVVATDSEGLVTFWNPAAEALLGYSCREALGRHITFLITLPEDLERAEQTLQGLLSGEAWSGEILARRKGGTVLPLLIAATPLRDGQDSVVGIVGVTVDLAERRSTEITKASLACLVEASADAIIGTLSDGLIDSFNPAAEELFGYCARDVIGKSVAMLAVPGRGTATGPVFTATLGRGGPIRDVPAFGIRKDGTRFPLLISAAPAKDDSGQAVAISWIARDVTAAVAAERALTESERRFKGVFEASPFGMVLVSEEGLIVDANRAFAVMVGWENAALIGTPMVELVHQEDRGRGREAFLDLLNRRVPSSQLEKRYLHRDGSIRWGRTTGVRLDTRGGGSKMALSIIDDITERVHARLEKERLVAELEQKAVTDDLTGLPNRALLEQHLSRSVQRLWNPRKLLGVIFIDMDRLKVVNDSVGHAAGDRLLVEVAGRLSGAVRSGDFVGRFGGDEFVVVAEDVASPGDLETVSERILAALSEPVNLDGLWLTPSASLGIVYTSDAGATTANLLSDGELAMYRAKHRGGGRTQVFDPVWREGAMTRLSNEVELRQAIGDGQLAVYYQPCMTPDGRVGGVEALVRWSHPLRGVLCPSEFIPLAEETGLIVPLGQWVLRTACEQVAAWRSSGHPHLSVAVNVSTRQLACPGHVSAVTEALATSGLPSEALCLEVTETALLNDLEDLVDRLNELRDLGVRIAIDDFGTGYSSLLRLRHLPAQVIKLDRSFVSGLGENADDMAIVRSVIDLAHDLGCTAVAEGVETAGQAAVLGNLGCDHLQGYFWSPPVEAALMSSYLESQLVPADVDRQATS